jgi:murein DD-endopeptidase MepM/ murein hydrolase activator NlpD
VKRGDTLTAICRDCLKGQGKPADALSVHRAVQQVSAANQLSDPDLIFPGQSISLNALVDQRPDTLARAEALPRKPVGGPAFPAAVERGLAGTRRIALESATFGGQTAPRNVTDASRMLESVAKTVQVRNAVATTLPSRPWESVLEGSGVLTSPFGMRRDPFTGHPAFHKGIDIAAARGTEIQAYDSGEVVFSGWRGGYGNLVVLRHPNGLETRYGHASELSVKVGDTVRTGQVVGKVGSTGRSTGDHLHFEVRVGGEAVNPLPYLKNRTALQVAEVF